MAMADDARIAQIVERVRSLLDALLTADEQAAAAALLPGSFIKVGMDLFGIDALSVALGLAAEPHHIGITALQAGDDLAVAELRGRNEADEDVSICSMFLTPEAGEWLVADIWPVSADSDLDPESIPEPTGQFYTGDMQLPLREGAAQDQVEALLLPQVQQEGAGLHVIERGIHLWRSFRAEAPGDLGDAAGWAAGLSLAIDLLDGREPDPTSTAARFGTLPEAALTRFTTLLSLLEPPEEEELPRAQSPILTPGSTLLDASGRPIGPSRQAGGGGGLIIPRG